MTPSTAPAIAAFSTPGGTTPSGTTCPIHNGEITGSVTLYYDPLLEVHMPSEREPSHRFGIAQWILPTHPEDARVLVESAIDMCKWRTDAPVVDRGGWSRETHFGMVFAKEYGDGALFAKLKAHAEANYEPTWDMPPASSPGASA